MARIRSIHPGIFTDDAYMALSFPARELIKGLWCEADDQGIFAWKPRTLKARIMPADDIDLVALLGELTANDFIMAFEVNDCKFGAIRNFQEFQRPKKPNSVHPITVTVRKYVGSKADRRKTSSPPVPPQLPIPPEKPPQMEDVIGKREEESPPLPPLQGGGEAVGDSAISKEPPVDGGENVGVKLTGRWNVAELEREFDRWWTAMPKRSPHTNSRKDARVKWMSLVKSERVTIARLLAGARGYASAMLAAGKEPHGIKQGITWLNAELWEQYAPEQSTAEATTGGLNLDVTRRALAKWRDGETWPKYLGAAPGEPGCKVPADLLVEFMPAVAPLVPSPPPSEEILF